MSNIPIFLDIFRRADQNDDQKLDKKEFFDFFADGVVTGTPILHEYVSPLFFLFYLNETTLF